MRNEVIASLRLRVIQKFFTFSIILLKIACIILSFFDTVCISTANADPMPWGKALSKDEQALCNKSYDLLPSSLKEGSTQDPNELDQYDDIIRNYNESCLRPWSTLRPQVRENIENIAGSLFVSRSDREDLLCGAFRINQQYVVTAAHCLWLGDMEIDGKALTFRLFSSPERKFISTGVLARGIHSSGKIADIEDYAVLNIDTSEIPFQLNENLLSKVLPFNQFIFIAGLNIFEYNRKYSNVREAILSSMRVDKGRSCFRHRVENTTVSQEYCVYTKCQTAPAMSGAPIFGYDFSKNRVFVGGIHLRAGFLHSGHSERECGHQTQHNVGITLPQFILDLNLKLKEINR